MFGDDTAAIETMEVGVPDGHRNANALQAKAELKGLMPEDAKEATGHGVRAKRSKSGAVSHPQTQSGRRTPIPPWRVAPRGQSGSMPTK
jgi:hypothetical protein